MAKKHAAAKNTQATKPPPPTGKRWAAGESGNPNGRPKGSLNKATKEAKAFCSSLTDDPVYQAKLRKDFRARTLEPSIEQMIWYYAKGKPKERVELGADKSLATLVKEAVGITQAEVDNPEREA